jgi:hypothetical protein
LFRALGHSEPPVRLVIQGQIYYFAHLYKHDSWAATARYVGPSGAVVCKFNRTQPIFGLPMAWLGRLLARREAEFLQRMDDLSGIPKYSGRVEVDGCPCLHAAAHDFVAGEPLGTHRRVSNLFFPALRALLAAMHFRGMAYVDLHKCENVLVGRDGMPYLIDFQVCFGLWSRRWAQAKWAQSILRALQEADLYHLAKHISRFRPDQKQLLQSLNKGQRPWWINIHRGLAVPLRKLRRSLLSWLGIRQKGGRGETEVFPEEALRHRYRRAA